MDFVENDEALGGNAALSRIDQTSSGADGCSEIEIGVLEHQVGIATAELEHGLFQERAGFAGDRASGGAAAGEGGRAHQRVFEHRADLCV